MISNLPMGRASLLNSLTLASHSQSGAKNFYDEGVTLLAESCYYA